MMRNSMRFCLSSDVKPSIVRSDVGCNSILPIGHVVDLSEALRGVRWTM
jgi:hypothetical protein